MHDESSDPSFLPTPAETPLTGTSRVPTRESQSSFSQPTKSHSPHQTAPSTAPTSTPPSRESVDDQRPHQVKFILSDSPESSPPSTPAAPAPTTPKTQPFPDPNDPYRRSKRKPQTTNLAEIPDRFHFEKVTKKRQSQQLHYYDPSSGQHSSHYHHHGASGLLHNLSNKSLKDLVKAGHHDKGHESSGEELHEEHTGSQVSLRRFFRGAGVKKSSRPSTPVTRLPSQPTVSHHTRPPTPPPAAPARKSADKKRPTMPFGDDHANLGLTDRYGKFGKVLGAGAGGSVRLMKRASDGTTFAVKEFRPRGEQESAREYAKKVNAEFTIGSILSHQNIVETLDIVNEGGRYFEVMEYCRYDLFAIVMTGKQTEEEIGCCFKQICAGVRYLHEMGLAHRDLKLDNCVVNEFGIVKIIDFGCAVVFKYPFEQDLIEATGIVGSDPYLAPEVCTEIRYDPQPADIWSLAIIYWYLPPRGAANNSCMVMRRFPWKAPRMSDPSFKNFASSPNPYTSDSRSSSLTVSRKTTLDSSVTLTHTDTQFMASGNHQLSPTESNGSQIKKNELPPPPPPINKGPMKLLNRVNPPQSRPLIGRMLDLNPKTRAKMDEIWSDPWFMSLKRCEMIEEIQPDGSRKMVVKRDGTHTHVLVGPSGEDVTPSGSSIKRVSAQQSRSGRDR